MFEINEKLTLTIRFLWDILTGFDMIKLNKTMILLSISWNRRKYEGEYIHITWI
jgi:hypothetical protein